MASGAPAAPEPEPAPEEPQRKVPPEIEELIAGALDMIADEDGYAFMGELGNLLIRQQPDFDPRNYGFSKLTQLIKSLDRLRWTCGRRRTPIRSTSSAGQEAEVEGGAVHVHRARSACAVSARPRRAAAGGPLCRRADLLRPRKKKDGDPGKGGAFGGDVRQTSNPHTKHIFLRDKKRK